MKLYLVREFGTTKIHGIFWAETPAALWDAVDEMADPVFFEWAEIVSPGGVWRDESLSEVEGVPERDKFPDGDAGEQAFDKAYCKVLSFGFTRWGDHMFGMMDDQDEWVWERFDAADEGVGMVARAIRRARARTRDSGRGRLE
jgi:hypothetical protein